MKCGSPPWRVRFDDSFLDTGLRIAKVAALDQTNAQARSSVGEHYLDTVGVGGSIPPVPTSFHRESRAIRTPGCYPAQSLTEPSPFILQFAPGAAGRSAVSRCSRSEKLNRE